MILKYYYIGQGELLTFGADLKTDIQDVGAIPHTNEYYVKYLTRKAAELGRRFIKFERVMRSKE